MCFEISGDVSHENLFSVELYWITCWIRILGSVLRYYWFCNRTTILMFCILGILVTENRITLHCRNAIARHVQCYSAANLCKCTRIRTIAQSFTTSILILPALHGTRTQIKKLTENYNVCRTNIRFCLMLGNRVHIRVNELKKKFWLATWERFEQSV